METRHVVAAATQVADIARNSVRLKENGAPCEPRLLSQLLGTGNPAREADKNNKEICVDELFVRCEAV
jgi:hypothetical protein